jgi:hypothetical protein
MKENRRHSGKEGRTLENIRLRHAGGFALNNWQGDEAPLSSIEQNDILTPSGAGTRLQPVLNRSKEAA